MHRVRSVVAIGRKEPDVTFDNSVTISGNTTREPELRFTTAGRAVCQFGVAVNRRWQNRQTNQWEETVSFFDVTCWAQLAENVAESVAKGARVLVCGRLEQQSWTTPDGQPRSKVQIVADDVGPSLKWATAELTRNPRPAAPATLNPAERGYDPDDEPF
jgi:single-strand DNA-binding protein